jgi:hypothetical protein
VKKLQVPAVVFFTVCIPAALFAQNQYLDMGRFSFYLTPKILKDGSIIDFGLGYEYTEHTAGEIRLRFSSTAKKEEFDGTVPDSLNAVEENNFEIFLMPFEYFFVKKQRIKIQAGMGVYYAYNTLAEKGYFNMPVLETLGKEKINSFSNDFTMHVLGPNLETGFSYRGGWFDLSVRGGVVPVFYLGARQKMEITPLMEPDYADYSQNTAGSPYVYADAGFVFFRYVSLALLYDFSRLNYQVVDFDTNLNWYNPERTAAVQSLKAEASLLIPLQSAVYIQIGYGYTFDSIQLDSGSPVRSSRQYLIFSTKTIR